MSELRVTLPDVGEGLDRAEIVAWLVKPGEQVARDETVVQVETDKSVVDLPAPATGTLTSVHADVGASLAVGDVLYVLDVPKGVAPQASAARAGTSPVAGESARRDDGASAARHGRTRSLAAPSVRRRALEAGLDIDAIRGTGPAGRVRLEDVENAASSPQAAEERQADPAPAQSPRETRVIPLRGLRRQTAENLTRSWTQIPHVTDLREIDATGLVAARERLRDHFDRRGITLSYLPFFIRAVCVALRAHPMFNSTVDMERGDITVHGSCNIGIATNTPDGLLLACVHNAEELSFEALARETTRLADAGRKRTLSPQETSGATFTLSNFGSLGGWLGTPVIPPGQSGIIGVGRIADGVLAVDGAPVVRSVLPMSTSADHRAVDGSDIGEFCTLVAELLSDPVLLLAHEG